jgi:lipid A 3-O-deacylase
MRVLQVFVALTAAAAAASGALAQVIDPAPEGDLPPPVESSAPVPARFGAIWENDSLYHTYYDGEDSDYTEGLRFDLSWQPPAARRWADKLPFAEGFRDPRAAIGVTLGQNLYTPDDLGNPNLNLSDHPYGAWLYGGFYLQRTDAHKRDHIELDVGVSGEWAAGEPTQKFIHRLIDSPNPKGWDHQIGEEVGANLVANRSWKFALWERGEWKAEALPYAGAVAGTINLNASGGAVLRIGYDLPEDFGVTRIGFLSDQTAASGHGLGVYLFGRVGGRVVGHDTFLDGSLFRDDDPSVGHRPLVGEAQLGFAVRITDWLDIHYSQTWWTAEYDRQGHGQHFAAYAFNIHFEF